MTIKAVKYKLTNTEISFVEQCLDVFEASGLAGLLNHVSNHSPWDNLDIKLEDKAPVRQEVYWAVAQSISVDLQDAISKAGPLGPDVFIITMMRI